MNPSLRALPFDAAALTGLSAALLTSHHQNNYGGAVKRLGALRDQLRSVSFDQMSGFQINGLKREELIATNSMLLHELYFAGLGASEMPPPMALALEASFGSVERWKSEFVAMGKALGGGSGWVVLNYQSRESRLVNQWAADHTHALAGGTPILALDMYEHAYHLDYGARAGDYVDAFMRNIGWAGVYQRYQAAIEAAHHTSFAEQSEVGDALLLDVRRRGIYEPASTLIEGARWHDPAQIDIWAADLPTDREIIVYCVYGHEVSQAAALRLRARGLAARSLRGGIDAWQAAGRPLADKG
jgi:Fe-Mn family superoxide dismutase